MVKLGMTDRETCVALHVKSTVFRAGLAVLSLLPAAPSGAAPVRELSVHSDYCAILHALTDRGDATCPARRPTAPTRSMQGDGQDSRAALSPGDDGYENGYFIHFAFDSAVLEPAYQAHLDRLSQVLNSPALTDTCLKLVGHTDATGPAEYNQTLSTRRAQSVADYLEDNLTGDGVTVAVAGMGEMAPIAGYSPRAAIQRRVEVLSRHKEGQCQ